MEVGPSSQQPTSRQEAEVLFEDGPSRLVEAGGAEVLRCYCATQKIQQPWRPHGYIGKITARQSPWPGGRQRQRGHPPRGPDGRSSQEAEEAGAAPGSQPTSQPALQAAGQPAPPQSRSEPGAAPEANLRQSRGKPVANPVANLRQTSLPSGLSRGTYYIFGTPPLGTWSKTQYAPRGLNRYTGRFARGLPLGLALVCLWIA